MSYRLDEVIDFLFDVDDNEINPDFRKIFYDLFLSDRNSANIKLELPDFSLDEEDYPAKTFIFSKDFKKEIDYCEGKCSYHYDVFLRDKTNDDCYNVVVNMYNGEIEDFDIEYSGKFKKPDCCSNKKIVSVNAKCDDTFSCKEDGKDWVESSPSSLKLGSEDYIEFKYCKSCGMIQF